MLDSDSPNPFANADAMLAYSELSIEKQKLALRNCPLNLTIS